MPTGASHSNWEFDGFKVLTEARLLLSQGTPVSLTSKAFDTLVLLIANRDRVVTRTMLLENLWDYRFDPHTSLIDTHISRLRKDFRWTWMPTCIPARSRSRCGGR